MRLMKLKMQEMMRYADDCIWLASMAEGVKI